MNPTIQMLYERRRELPIALAHAFAGTKLGNPRAPVLNRVYGHLRPGEKMACMVELNLCRQARRAALGG